MKNVNIISQGKNYKAIDIGSLDKLSARSYFHPKLNVEIRGKVFVGEALESQGSEISFQFIPPKMEIPFFHKHKTHEEIYIIIKGSGQFKVDDDQFDISEGSIIRIAPEGKRTWRNNSTDFMILIVVQAKNMSLTQHYIGDGYGVKEEVKW